MTDIRLGPWMGNKKSKAGTAVLHSYFTYLCNHNCYCKRLIVTSQLFIINLKKISDRLNPLKYYGWGVQFTVNTNIEKILSPDNGPYLIFFKKFLQPKQQQIQCPWLVYKIRFAHLKLELVNDACVSEWQVSSYKQIFWFWTKFHFRLSAIQTEKSVFYLTNCRTSNLSRRLVAAVMKLWRKSNLKGNSHYAKKNLTHRHHAEVSHSPVSRPWFEGKKSHHWKMSRPPIFSKRGLLWKRSSKNYFSIDSRQL